MGKKKVGFIVTQESALKLVLNSDYEPTYEMFINIVGDEDDFNKAVTHISGIYYCKSVGWEPIVSGHLVTFEALGIKDEILINKLKVALNKVGNDALKNLFKLGKVLWDSQEVIKPISSD